MFGRKAKERRRKRFEELISSDRYKNSDYVIQKVNGKYGIKIKNSSSSRYVDLVDSLFSWNNRDSDYDDCFSRCSDDVVDAFNYRLPIIEPIETLEEY